MNRLLTIIIATMMIFNTAEASKLKIGQTAPDFTLNDQNNTPQTLSKQRGKWVVIYFYPKDNTPGCTTEACNFRDHINELINKKATIFGISVDNSKSHQKFAEKNNLPFSLLSDSNKSVSKKYGALLNLFFVKVSKRHSFIINPNGKIMKIYRKVNPKNHVQQVLKDLTELQTQK